MYGVILLRFGDNGVNVGAAIRKSRTRNARVTVRRYLERVANNQ
jgi:hypothetical protein